MNIKRGDVVKIFHWHGIVKDVFVSESGRMAVEIYCIKHAMKHQFPEIFLLDDVDWSYATLHDLLTERIEYQEQVNIKANEIFALYDEKHTEV